MFFTIASANALENATQSLEGHQTNASDDNVLSADSVSYTPSDLENSIKNANHGDEILINPGTYKIHNIQITKNITLQGNGDPNDIIIDGEEKSSIFLIRSPNVKATFKNITFINGLTSNFGGAISIETGNVYVDNCIFINNTALDDTNAGAISNYGTKQNRGYLFVNNSIFINNHADHDGGAITTCYANSDIYNCVFINNSAHRDGGAIRVSVYGYGNVQDCIFMFNHADEWGGAYYSWSGESNIERCIFLNNTAGTNGGAVMVSGNINIESSIIANNDGGETGGSFYIQQPMYDTKTVINVHDNIITNNTSPYGKEIFIKWWDSYNLYTQFDNNDWGDEDPNDPSINDPNNVTSRSKVNKTIKSNLFDVLNVNLLNRYSNLIKNYFPNDSLDTLKKQFKTSEYPNGNKEDKSQNSDAQTASQTTVANTRIKINSTKNTEPVNENENTQPNVIPQLEKSLKDAIDDAIVGDSSSSYGEDEKAYELNKTDKSAIKQTDFDLRFFIGGLVMIFLLLAIGYKIEKNKNK